MEIEDEQEFKFKYPKKTVTNIDFSLISNQCEGNRLTTIDKNLR